MLASDALSKIAAVQCKLWRETLDPAAYRHNVRRLRLAFHPDKAPGELFLGLYETVTKRINDEVETGQ